LKNLLICLFITVIFSSDNFFLHNFINTTFAQQKPSIPSYAKWGQIAIHKTKERYPQANIVDYLHIGRSKDENTSEEKFKLWLKENNKEFGVFVNIIFDNKTEQIIEVNFRETTR